MRRNIVVERARGIGTENQRVEVVERKGLGHPDYIADSIAEAFSRNLSLYYIDNFGKILHHNVDKLEIIGGMASPEFGGGQVILPMSVLFSGRATDFIENQRIPVREIATESALEWIKKNIRFIDGNSIRFLFETKSSSASLTSIYERLGVFSNDTSFGTGFAPLTPTENLVLELEKGMNSADFKALFPFSGEDVKILAVRNRKNIDITVANAFVDRYVPSIDAYFDEKARLLDELADRIRYLLPPDLIFQVSLNALDRREQGKDGCYLTVTGTSAEQGDDGAVGRGNRVNGLITPNRLMSFEAIAGKNPVNHIGKIYNILSGRIAQAVYDSTGLHNEVKIAGKIGDPIDQPQVAVVSTTEKISKDDRHLVKLIVDDGLSGIEKITSDLVQGKISVC